MTNQYLILFEAFEPVVNPWEAGSTTPLYVRGWHEAATYMGIGGCAEPFPILAAATDACFFKILFIFIIIIFSFLLPAFRSSTQNEEFILFYFSSLFRLLPTCKSSLETFHVSDPNVTLDNRCQSVIF